MKHNRRFLLIAAIVLLASLLIAGAAMADAPTAIKLTLNPDYSTNLEYSPYHYFSINKYDGGLVQTSYEPEDADIYDYSFKWTSSDTSVATLDYSLLSGGFYNYIYVYKPGKITITVQLMEDGVAVEGLTSSVDLEFKEVPVTKIYFDATSYESKSDGFSLYDKLTVEPTNATYGKDYLKWTSDKLTVAKVNGSGYIEKRKAGTATITATSFDGKVSASVPVTFAETPITGITIDNTTIELYEGDSFTLSATITPSDASESSLKWTSSNPSVATVSNDGYVYAKKAGTSVITVASASDATIKAECTVTVVANPITAIAMDSTAVELYEGDSFTLSATITPSDASGNLKWTSSNPSVATVSNNGYVYAKKAGTSVITVASASDATIKAECTVTVVANQITALAFSQAEISLKITDNSINLANYLNVTPTDYAKDSITWTSSDITVATVSENGYVNLKKPGTVTITAASEKNPTIKASCTVKVEAVNATAVAFNQSAIEVEQYSIYALHDMIQFTPADATVKTVTFSTSDPDAVTLEGTYGAGYDWLDNMYAVKVGTSVITVTARNYDDTVVTGTMTVTVKAPTIEGFAFAKTEYSLSTSSTKGLDLERRLVIKPSDRKFQDVFGDDPENLIWDSSDATIASVSESGYVTPVSVGEAEITVTYAYDETISATVKVTVTGTPVKKIALNRTSIEFSPDDTTRSGALKLTYQPKNADIKEIYWKISNPKIANIYGDGPEANGTTYGVYNTKDLWVSPNDNGKVGTATITVYVDDGVKVHEATCEVKVAYPAKKWALKNSKVTLSLVSDKGTDNENNTYGFYAWNSLYINDPDYDGTYSATYMTWKSSKPKIATIDKNGNITALKAGKTVITGTSKDGNKTTVKCTVTIKKYKITSLTAVDRTIRIGQVIDLFNCEDPWITILPKTTSRVKIYNDTLTYKSSNTSVVSVKNGKLSALKAGKAKITVTAKDGKKKVTFNVTVVKNIEVDE